MGEGLGDFDVYEEGPKSIKKNQEKQNNENALSDFDKTYIKAIINKNIDSINDKQFNGFLLRFKGQENDLLKYLENYDFSKSEDLVDDVAQIENIMDSVEKKLGIIKDDIEKQKDIPFEILGGQILVQNIDYKGGIKFKKGKKEWKEITGDDTIEFNSHTNRFEVNIDHKGFPKHLELEYNGGNIIKVHDTRYKRTDRVNIVSKELTIQDITRYDYNKMKVASYQTPREIDIPFRGQRIKLVVLFKKEK